MKVSFLMVVNDFNLRGVAFIPVEAYSPLFVDSDTELTRPVAGQPFKLIVGRHTQER
jgi:hypothetical protein